MKNNTLKQPNLYALEKFENFTPFYIWVSLLDLIF
jgi:hypothetical protein